jgi:hypothetical protein
VFVLDFAQHFTCLSSTLGCDQQACNQKINLVSLLLMTIFAEIKGEIHKVRKIRYRWNCVSIESRHDD